MFRLKQVSRAVLALCAGGLALTAVAQQQQPATKSLERVEVTGSRIKRVDTETPAPVQVINREQIERSGATTVTDLLKTLPANNVGAFDENAVASFSPGAGGASVRGLGAQATLILINGRRIAPYGFANGGQQTFVDVNSIPVDAIERIDVLLDGASAIYGSDAMGGVINIIMRKDFQGFQARASYGISSERDGNTPKVGFTFGKGSLATDKYNIFLHFDTTKRDSISASDRDTTRNADFRRFGMTDLRSSYANPGNFYEIPADPTAAPAGGAYIGPAAGCSTISTDPTAPALAGRCIYDATNYQDIQGDIKRHNMFLSGTVELGADTQLFGDLMLTRSELKQRSPSYSSSTYYSTGTLDTAYLPVAASHPDNPYGRDVALRYRFNDVERSTQVQSDTQRMTFGGRTTVGGWDTESALVYSRSETKVAYTGLIRDSVLLDGVLDPGTGFLRDDFRIGNVASNPALLAALYPTLREKGTTSTTSFDIRATGELGSLPGGPIGVAIGADFRRETFKSIPDELAGAGEISVLGTSSADGKRNVGAAFIEFSLPLLKSVEAQLAARMDRYSDFGTATTPKVGLKWKALSNLALRGTYAEGFRAPSLVETSGSPVTGFYSGIRDPLLCPDPVATPTDPNCDLSVRNVSGANANLNPEKSKGLTLGIVFEPVDDVTLAIDWFKIKRKNEIASLEPDYLLAHESEFPGFVQRDPVTNEIVQLNTLLTNLGTTQVTGHDVDLRAKLSVGEYGKVSPFITYSAMPKYKVRPTAEAEEVDYAGTYLQPKERMRFGAVWETGPWTASITWNYTGSYSRAFSPTDPVCSYQASAPQLCNVKSWTTADVFIGYKGIKNLDLGLTIQNIDNQEAPFDERMVTRYTAFRSSYHNQMGRFFTLGAKYTFW